MARKEIKVRGNDGRKQLTVVIEDITTTTDTTTQEAAGGTQGEADVEAYQEPSSKTIVIDSGNQRLTITIAE